MQEAIESKDMSAITQAVLVHGLCLLPDYNKHLNDAIAQGDAGADLAEFLLENKEQLYGPEPAQVTWEAIHGNGRVENPQMFDVLYRFYGAIHKGRDYINRWAWKLVDLTKKEIYVHISLDFSSSYTRVLHLSPYCSSLELVQRLFQIVEQIELYPRSNVFGSIATNVYRRALFYQNLEVLEFVSAYKYDDDESILDVIGWSLRWTAALLLEQELTERSQAVWKQMLKDYRTRNRGEMLTLRYYAYMIGGEALVGKSFNVDKAIDYEGKNSIPEQFLDAMLMTSPLRVSEDRVYELIHDHISEKARNDLRAVVDGMVDYYPGYAVAKKVLDDV